MAKHPGGRPLEYDSKMHPLMAENLALKGYTNEEIAKEMGIHLSTVYEWKNRYTEFSDALTKGKFSVDDRVEDSLLKRALGFTKEVEKTYITKDGNEIKYTEKVSIDSDPASMFFWLKNRRRDKWKDRYDGEISGTLTVKSIGMPEFAGQEEKSSDPD